ncbi:MAG: TonB-dependent receptor [Saprospiraceae bacterium]|nr:TonB-dependent receptor [Saprospiraceae bacterium]
MYLGKISLLFLFILTFQSQIWSQSTLFGLIIDGETKEPLISVTVSIKDTAFGTVTDVDGNYNISLKKGVYTLLFTYIGYNTVEKEVTSDGKSIIELNISMAPMVMVNETIIVTDGRYEKRLEESTVAIDVIGTKQIESNNITSLDEIVKKASGVQIIDGQINIRGGAGYAYGVGSRVIFLVDGQPLLSAELSDVKWNFMPIENAQQIEIIKGSASVLYGSGALNGVVNLRTTYPKGDKPYTAFSMYTGVYDQPKIDSMQWYKPEVDAAAMPMFAGFFFSHRQRPHKNLDFVLGGNIHLSNGYQQGVDERRFRFNSNTRYRLPKSDGRASIGINISLMYHEDGEYFLSKDMMNNAFINISTINRSRYLSISLDPFLTAFDKHNNKHDIRGRWFRISKLQNGPNSDCDLFSLEYQAQRKFPKKWILTGGIRGQYLHVNSILFADPTLGGSARSLFTGGSIATYAQIDKQLWDRLSFTLGLRWEGYLVDSTFTPTLPIVRAGLNLEASRNDFIRLSFGQGFRFPSMAERYLNENLPVNGLTLGIYPSLDLLPETGWTTEIGYRHKFNIRKFSFYTDIAFFWMEYDNMVEFAFDLYPQGPGFSFINVGKARIAGWELSVQSEGRIGKTPLRIWAGYTYSCPGDISSSSSPIRDPGKYIEFMFKTFANGVDRINDLNHILKYRSLHNVRIDVETELFGITIGSALNYSSFMQRIDALFDFGLIPGVAQFRQIHSYGYWLWDIRLGYRFNQKQRINFVVQNVMNEEYATRPAQMGAPRSFSLKYSHVF